MRESEGLVSRSRIHNWASVCLCVCVSVCVCHLSHSASATAKTTRDREKSSKQKMFLFALRFILLPGHFPLDPLPCPPEGGKRVRGSENRYSASATAKTTRDREKISKQKMLLFALRFILLPGHFPLDPLPCPPEGGKWGRGSPRK